MQEAIERLTALYEKLRNEEWVDKRGQRMVITGVRICIHALEKQVELIRNTPGGNGASEGPVADAGGGGCTIPSERKNSDTVG